MEKYRQSLDSYDIIPDGMRNYLRNYGKHFNSKMYDFAVSTMYKEDSNGNRISMKSVTDEQLDTMMKRYNIRMKNNTMRDACYVYTMMQSDFSDVVNEQVMLQLVAKYVDDVDKKDGFIFNRFYADCVHNGIPIDWDEML